MMSSSQNEVCRRVAQVRREYAGARGKSRFARELGIPASTYDYYEADRTPPAEVLVEISRVADVDLRWLLTGEVGSAVVADHPVLQRAARLIGRNSDAIEPLAAFLDILEGTLVFPDKPSSVAEQGGLAVVRGGEGAGEAERAEGDKVGARPLAADGGTEGEHDGEGGDASCRAEPAEQQRWIPVLGRSAAGVPAFWSQGEDVGGVTTLAELIERHADAYREPAMPAVVTGEAAEGQAAAIIAVRAPAGELQTPTEFIDAPAIKARYHDAFAVRIDGESMQPEVRHGDYVILSPAVEARAGAMAVVQLADAIGVTCKLYHPAGGQIHLVPINEAVAPTTVEAEQVEWALRVLARVRP